MTSHSIWTKLDRFPPVIVRLLAVSERGRLVEDAELATRSGLSLATVKWLSYETSWDSVPVGVMRRFVRVCGVDFGDPKRMSRFTRYVQNNPKYAHAQRSKDWPRFVEAIRQFAP